MFSLLKTRLRTTIIFITILLIAGLMSFELLAQNQSSRPDTKVKIIQFEPEEITKRESNITVRFSNDLVGRDSLNTTMIVSPLIFKPEIPGVARWLETDLLRFYPDNPLLPATEYGVRLDRSKSYINGNKINDKRKFVFQTEPLKINKFDWYPLFDKDNPGQIRLRVLFEFNYLVDLNKLKKKLVFKGKENVEKSSLEYEIENRDEAFAGSVSIVTEFFEKSKKDQRYNLIIKKGVGCQNCGEPLNREYKKEIRIRRFSRFFIRNMTAGFEYKRPVINLQLSKSIPLDYIKEYLTISPPVNFTLEQRYHTVKIKGDFKSGETYEVKLAQGAPSHDGSILENEFVSKVKIPDQPASLKFVSTAAYLPRFGAGLVELETTNVDSISVEIEQIFANNLVYAMTSNLTAYHNYSRSSLADIGRTFYSQTKKLESERNQPLTTSIDIGRIINDTTRGIFRLSARVKERRWSFDSRLVIKTDLGLMAKSSGDYLMVWVNSLDKAEPVAKAEIKLFSRNNQLLFEGFTDSRGIVIFENIKEKVKDYEPFLITAEKDDDLSYLLFKETLLPMTDFDIGGRPYLNDGYEAYLYLDRNIFRPGDSAYIVSIVRTVGGETPPEFPYFLIIRDPAGREFKSFRVKTSGRGLLELAVAIPDFARTGLYTLIARIGEDYEIGRSSFQVEEFIPDKIKTKVITDKDEYNSGDTAKIDVAGTYLFGPPTAGHKVSGHLTLESHNFYTEGKAAYSFSDSERKFSRIEIDLGDNLLNDSGKYTYKYEIPENLRPPSALKGLLSASVSEQGGRAVNDYSELIIHPYDRYVGVKLNFDGYAKPGEPFKVGLIAVNPEGNELAIKNVRIEFYRIIYHSLLKPDSRGYYRYVSEKKEVLIDSAKTALPRTGATISFTPPQNGRYKVVVLDQKGGHSAARFLYASGWHYAPWSMENPDRIEIDFDKNMYTPGENAKVQIRAPFSGTLLLTVEKEKVLEFITYQMESNSAEINLPIKSDYFPNVYISATIIKKAKDVNKATPARAYGVAPLKLSNQAYDLGLSIIAPEVIKPNEKVQIKLNLKNSQKAEVTLAAVDAGIMQLTDYKTVDPLGFFYGQKQLYLKAYDIYSLVYPEIERAASHLSPAGGRRELYESSRKRHLNPIKSRRVKPVSLWSGIVKTDENGQATVRFDIPQFNGKLILTAVAVAGKKFGTAVSEMIVRDKIVLQESFPRFISPGDIVEGLVTIFNNSGKNNSFNISLECDGPIKIISPAVRSIKLAKNSEGNVVFKVKAGLKPGKVIFKIIATDTVDSTQLRFELPNRPVQPLKTKFGSGMAGKNMSAFFEMPTCWVEGSEQYILKTSGFSALGFTQNINYLLRYPYGCLEQTTSRLFPLLYFNDLMRFADPDLAGSGGAEYFIREGILKLSGMLGDDGTFSFWPGGQRHHYWSSVYASHFLLEAQKAGYYLDESFDRQIRKSLYNIAAGKEKNLNISERIYAAYVLAGAGKLKRKIVSFLHDIKYDDLPPFSRYLLAGALARSGDIDLARSLIPTDIHPAIFEPETGGTFSSGVRTNAILLDVLNEIDPQNPSTAAIAFNLMQSAHAGRWSTTQENAFGLMALGKYLSGQSNMNFEGIINIDDRSYKIDNKDFQLQRKDIGGKNISISLDGDGSCFYFWQASGVPVDNAPEEFSRGITISREYLDINGSPIDYHNISLGEQIICHIKAKATDNSLSNVVINDLLPAGLEIENPRLKTTPKLSWLPKPGRDIEHQDIRDDRLLLFTSLNTRREVEYYYSLRAISAGQYNIPPIAAECMYNPTIAAAASSGLMTIKAYSKGD